MQVGLPFYPIPCGAEVGRNEQDGVPVTVAHKCQSSAYMCQRILAQGLVTMGIRVLWIAPDDEHDERHVLLALVLNDHVRHGVHDVVAAIRTPQLGSFVAQPHA